MINISIFDFNTAVISRRRQGTPDDPYIDIQESQQIINNKAILSEIPDTFTKVQVSGQDITWIETTGVPSENQYQVDYNEALVLFHESRNGLTFSFSFKGTGAHYLNAKRVFTQVSETGEILETLQDIVDIANEVIVSESQRIINESQRIINEDIRSDSEDIRSDSEDIRIANEITRVNAENARITGGALIKSGDIMTGNLNMGENEIQLGGFKIKYNPSLNSLDIEF